MHRFLAGILVAVALLTAGVVHAGTTTTSGSLTAGGADCSVAGRCLTLPVVSTGNGTLEVRGTFVGTALLECSIAGVSYSTVPLNPIAGTAAVTSLTAPGMWLFSGAFGVCRVRLSAYTSGTATVDLLLTDASVPRVPSLAVLGAAPSDATFVTTAASAGLSAERVLTGTANQLTITDNGANSTVVLSIPAALIAPGSIAATTTVTGTQLIASDKIRSNGTAPVVSNTSANSCGTTAATLAGTDVAGKITVGTVAGTSCTVTFATAWPTAPACLATNETTANLLRATSTTTTVIIAGTMVAADVLAYVCVGGS